MNDIPLNTPLPPIQHEHYRWENGQMVPEYAPKLIDGILYDANRRPVAKQVKNPDGTWYWGNVE